MSRRRPWKGCRPWITAPRNLPAYGAWNVEKVAMGTGEALAGPAMLRTVAGASRPITGLHREVAGCRVGVGGGRTTA
jgi:hypothetical protein